MKTNEAELSEQEKNSVSRRRVLQAAAAIIPLRVGSRVAAALAPFGIAHATRQSSDDLLALGARDAVARIASGDISAESYVAQLLKQYEAHKDLNAVIAIDEARVMEAARAVDRSRARGAKLGAAAGLPFAVKDQIAVAGLPATGGTRRSSDTFRSDMRPSSSVSSPRVRFRSARRRSRHECRRWPHAPNLRAQRVVRRGA
jgi:hypothetical protein